jgi:hypothetical protein
MEKPPTGFSPLCPCSSSCPCTFCDPFPCIFLSPCDLCCSWAHFSRWYSLKGETTPCDPRTLGFTLAGFTAAALVTTSLLLLLTTTLLP